MSIEWDEKLARQLFQNLGGSLAAWSVDFWTFFQMGKSEHDRAESERIARQTAEAERDALAEKVADLELIASDVLDAQEAMRSKGLTGEERGIVEREFLDSLDALRAILSDQEER